MDRSFAVLYSEHKTQKNKTWHDGTLTMADGYTVLKTMDGRVVHRKLGVARAVSVDAELDVGPFLVQVMQLHETGHAKAKEKSFRHRITYRKQSDALEREGIAEYDGKSMVVFKDGNGRQLVRKVCPEISEGETVCAGDYLVTVLEAVQRAPRPDIYSRKALVSKSAASAAATAQPEARPAAQHRAPDKAPDRVIPCIYTEDKQKKQKKWIDGTIKLTGSSAVIEDSDTRAVIHKRHFANTNVLADGYEFDGGRYRFQITEPTVLPDQEQIVVCRKRMLTVSEIRSRKEQMLVSAQASHSENEDNDTCNDTYNDKYNGKYNDKYNDKYNGKYSGKYNDKHSGTQTFPKHSSFTKAGSSSLFGMFDDLH